MILESISWGTTEVQQIIRSAQPWTTRDPICWNVRATIHALDKMDLAAEVDRSILPEHISYGLLRLPQARAWMSAMKGRVNGRCRFLEERSFIRWCGYRAPKWMRDMSLEWLYRLWLEPGRLWKRYLVTNGHFLFFSEKRSSEGLSKDVTCEERRRICWAHNEI